MDIDQASVIWASNAGPAGAPAGLVDAGAQASHAIALADRLDLHDAFASARRLLKRADQLNQQGREAQARAQVERGQLLAKLLADDGPMDPDEVRETLARSAPWIGAERGAEGLVVAPAPAMDLIAEASRHARGRAGQAVAAESPGLYVRLQDIAGECVRVTMAQPEPPASIWGGGTDASRRAMVDGYEAPWGQLARAADRFARVQEFGAYLRRLGGFGREAMLDLGEPWGFTYLEWELAAAGEQELRSIPPVLRLRYTAAHDWQPGLYLRADHDRPAPPRPSLLSRFAKSLVYNPALPPGERMTEY